MSYGQYEPVIGLEVHAQLLTKTKMFSGCHYEYGSQPNSLICPITSGQPGTLPVINKKAVELGVKMAIALDMQINEVSVFARKNYFYPDLPKGYQISQYDKPYAENGKLNLLLPEGESKTIGITRIHFEEDAGKTSHQGDHSLVDLNRAGAPLMEIVSEPDMRSPQEAGQYLKTLHSYVKYTEVSDGDLEKGNFRCDANVSVRLKGDKKFGTRVELKNINSFKFVEKAIDYEIKRQIKAIESGEKIIQQTRGYDNQKGTTYVMRDKEEASDYRYFPEPDLPPLVISSEWIDSIKKTLPELPQQKRDRFQSQYQLTLDEAILLTSTKELSQYYEEAVAQSKLPKLCSNWIANELLAKLKEAGREITDSPITPTQIAQLAKVIDRGEISGKMGKVVFEDMFLTRKDPVIIIAEKGLVQMNDAGEIETIIDEIMAAHTKEVEAYRGGKTKLLGFFVGQVMKKTQGQANPATVNQLLKKKLDG